MSFEQFLAFALFASVSSITPGPNNLMLLTSGANYGLRRTIPHMFGISLGFFSLVALVGLGLGILFQNYPVILLVMKWLGVAYLLYLAWCIANAAAPKEQDDPTAKPMTMWNAMTFQFFNPKAWIMAISTFSTYFPQEHHPLMVIAIAMLYVIINFPNVGVWVLFGVKLRHYLQDNKHRKTFNYIMAGLLVLSLIPIL